MPTAVPAPRQPQAAGPVEPPVPPPPLTVTLGKWSAEVSLPLDGTAAQLADALAEEFAVAPGTIKLLLPPPARGVVRLGDAGEQLLAEAGIHPGMHVKMMASPAAAVQAVAAAEAAGAAQRTAGFDHELRRDLRRAGLIDSSSSAAGSGPRQGEYGFLAFQAWQRPGLTPPPSEALRLLHRLASDPGIVGVVNKWKWNVGLLSEMPPEGKVGISPVCILGVNINRGQEISLRLRTDDLKGFRRYDRIRETLLHELAHMVWGEHDDNFKQLNSQLRRACDAFDWRGAAARSLAGPAFDGSVGYDLPPERVTVMQQTAASSGQTLRQLAGAAGGGQAPPPDARQAAIEAAMQRTGLGTMPSPTSQQQQQQHFRKGDTVLYRQRDGTLEEAKVLAVDLSVQPPSYGIELGPEKTYRETEASRLAPLPGTPEDGAEDGWQVEGLGHRDAATEAKEAAVAALER
ncbi:hypothetical protein ABPG77_009827 [Micractinium sp. CCAP 211/92]